MVIIFHYFFLFLQRVSQDTHCSSFTDELAPQCESGRAKPVRDMAECLRFLYSMKFVLNMSLKIQLTNNREQL